MTSNTPPSRGSTLAAQDRIVVSWPQPSPKLPPVPSRSAVESEEAVRRVAHEINNALDGILRYVGMARRVIETSLKQDHGGTSDTAAPNAEVLLRYLDGARLGLTRMAAIVREVLSAPPAQKASRDQASVDRVVQEAIDLLCPEADRRGVIIAADFKTAALPTVDAGKLLQICVNLMKNAIEAMEAGGRLMISVAVMGREAVLRFADTGPGLPQPHEQLFEAGFTTKAGDRSRGMGLAISRDLARELGGSIRAMNAPEGGAVFIVRLPA